MDAGKRKKCSVDSYQWYGGRSNLLCGTKSCANIFSVHKRKSHALSTACVRMCLFLYFSPLNRCRVDDKYYAKVDLFLLYQNFPTIGGLQIDNNFDKNYAKKIIKNHKKIFQFSIQYLYISLESFFFFSICTSLYIVFHIYIPQRRILYRTHRHTNHTRIQNTHTFNTPHSQQCKLYVTIMAYGLAAVSICLFRCAYSATLFFC